MTQPHHRLLANLALSGLALLLPVAAIAQAGEAGAVQTYSLTPEAKAATLDAATETSAEIARAGPGDGGSDRQIHGEVSAMIGTGGSRGAYGVAAIPLGDNAGAVVSFESSRFGNGRRR